MSMSDVTDPTYQSAEQGKTVTFPPAGLDEFVPKVAKGTWKPR